MSDDRPNRARVVEMVARRRENASLGLQPPLGSVLGTKPLLGVNDDDYSGLGDALDAQQPDSQEFATLEHNAQIRMLCRLILDESPGTIDPRLLNELAQALDS